MEIAFEPLTHYYTVAGIDDEGRLYSNAGTGEFRLIDYESCPGEGPWDLEMIVGDDLSVLSIDSAGRLYGTADNTWAQLSYSFEGEED